MYALLLHKLKSLLNHISLTNGVKCETKVEIIRTDLTLVIMIMIIKVQITMYHFHPGLM